MASDLESWVLEALAKVSHASDEGNNESLRCIFSESIVNRGEKCLRPTGKVKRGTQVFISAEWLLPRAVMPVPKSH